MSETKYLQFITRNLNKLWCESTTNPVPVLRIAASRGFSEFTKKRNQVVPWSLHTSLKISCKSVQPFSRNLANKETNKERKKERKKDTYKQTKKSIENNTPAPDVSGTG